MPKPKYIVFAGAGVRGTAYAGSIDVLHRTGLLDEIIGYAGTSSGSLVASLMALGYASIEIINIFIDYNIKDQFGKFNLLAAVLDPFPASGLTKAEGVMDWLHEHIEKKNLDKNITFGELYKLTGKELHITATNVNTSMVEYLSFKTEPDMKIADAIRMSISIPGMMDAVMYKGNYYVDGGLLDNLPMSIFPESETIGIKTEGRSEDRTISTKQDFYLRLFWTPIANQIHRFYENHPNVIVLHVGNIGALDLNIDKKKRKELIMVGVRDTCKYLNIEYVN